MTHNQLQQWETDCIKSIVVVGSSANGRENQGLTPIDQLSYERFTNHMIQREVDQPDVHRLEMIWNTQ